MEATAYQSARTERPCYHVVVSFDVDDRPTRAEMEEVGDRVLERLGLADHQAVIVAHNDRPHAHIHSMVNRVHPEDGLGLGALGRSSSSSKPRSAMPSVRWGCARCQADWRGSWTRNALSRRRGDVTHVGASADGPSGPARSRCSIAHGPP